MKMNTNQPLSTKVSNNQHLSIQVMRVKHFRFTEKQYPHGDFLDREYLGICSSIHVSGTTDCGGNCSSKLKTSESLIGAMDPQSIKSKTTSNPVHSSFFPLQEVDSVQDHTTIETQIIKETI
ncbi:hypothetical protein Dsin_012208 [Dipteronia sinensis]|uniref:Uncharacterized protein n=1 Tax=Dipteronia sinensis TaxID=43782 RepID=A0AAE0AI36_9ROSI|nr:hypothetical protein Dsin_012208 [Dipteronia sinensis]